MLHIYIYIYIYIYDISRLRVKVFFVKITVLHDCVSRTSTNTFVEEFRRLWTEYEKWVSSLTGLYERHKLKVEVFDKDLPKNKFLVISSCI